MIFNPIVSGGGGATEFTITNNHVYGSIMSWPSTARAGELVTASGETGGYRATVTADGYAKQIPLMAETYSLPMVGDVTDAWFIMPSGNVTIE